MGLHLNTGNDDKIIKYYGLHRHRSGEQSVERMKKNTKFIS